MFKIGEHVRNTLTGQTGLVVSNDGSEIVIRDDQTGLPAPYFDDAPLVAVDSVPGPSAGDDPVHTAMLRVARNAGAAVTALEIIRREAKNALGVGQGRDNLKIYDALDFIEKFADDVLSHVLPA